MPKNKWFYLGISVLLVRAILGSSATASEDRVALVIGNGAYGNAPLANPTNDAEDVAERLRQLHFVVVLRLNMTIKQIGTTMHEFRSKLTPGAVALVFYAGHGTQINGENYLPSVDADINSEDDVPNQSMAVNQIMDVLDQSKTRLNLVFLDACRNNPFTRSFRSENRGLARITAPSGTLISYATRPGSVAKDGAGRNGLYTSFLLKEMNNTHQPIEQLLKRVVAAVSDASNGAQKPWMEGSVEGDFCFESCATLAPAPGGGSAENKTDTHWLLEREMQPVYFVLGSRTLTSESIETLHHYAELLKESGYKGLVLESHTKARDPAANINLAKVRSDYVRHVLIENGVAPEKLTAINIGGAEEALAPNSAYTDFVSFRVVWP